MRRLSITCCILAIFLGGLIDEARAMPHSSHSASLALPAQALPSFSDTTVAQAKARQLFVRGMTYAYLEEYDRAIRLYERALEHAPNEAAILSAMAEAQAVQDELNTAIFYAQQAQQAAPENAYYYRQLADLQEQAGNTSEAIQVYQQLVERFPDDVEARLKLARLLADTDQPRAALAVYEHLEQQIRTSPRTRLEMLQLYRRLDDTDGIRRTLQSLVESRPDEPFFRNLLAEFYTQHGEGDKALALYRKALDANPNDVEAALKLANLYRQQGQEDKAEALLDRALQSEGASAEQLVARAHPLYRRSSLDSSAAQSATRLLRRALELDPKNEKALSMLGTLRYRTGDYTEAGELLVRSLNLNPRSPERWMRAAGAFLQADQPKRAVDVAEEGLILFPGQLPLVRVAAYGLMETNQNDRAIERFKEALSLLDDSSSADPNQRASLLSALGLLYNRQDNLDVSDRYYEQALKANPEHTLALNNYAYSLAERGTKLDRALTLARRAVELAPGNASYLDTLGWVYFQRENFEEAEKWIGKSIETGQASATVYEHYGDVHKALGHPDTARRYWEKALERAPDRDALRNKLDALQH